MQTKQNFGPKFQIRAGTLSVGTKLGSQRAKEKSRREREIRERKCSAFHIFFGCQIQTQRWVPFASETHFAFECLFDA